METGLVRQGSNGAAVMRADLFGGSEVAPIVETSAAAVAAQAEAEVKARVALAIRNPRNIDGVRVALMKECKRPGFAESCWYRRKVGRKQDDAHGSPTFGQWIDNYVEGFGIRFAEAAQRCMGNVYSTSVVVYDGSDKRIVRVSVMDLESNSTFSQDVTLARTTERSKLKEGQESIGTRRNSEGQMVYIVEATDAEMVQKQGVETSKVLRNLILRHLPGDVLDDCKTQRVETLAAADRKDPSAARKKIVDGFAMIGVMPDALVDFLGCDLDAASPAQIDQLRAIFAGIRDGEATWTEIAGERKGGEAQGNSKLADLTAKAAEKKKQADEAKAAKAAAPAPAATGGAEAKTHVPSATVTPAKAAAPVATPTPAPALVVGPAAAAPAAVTAAPEPPREEPAPASAASTPDPGCAGDHAEPVCADPTCYLIGREEPEAEEPPPKVPAADEARCTSVHRQLGACTRFEHPPDELHDNGKGDRWDDAMAAAAAQVATLPVTPPVTPAATPKPTPSPAPATAAAPKTKPAAAAATAKSPATTAPAPAKTAAAPPQPGSTGEQLFAERPPAPKGPALSPAAEVHALAMRRTGSKKELQDAARAYTSDEKISNDEKQALHRVYDVELQRVRGNG